MSDRKTYVAVYTPQKEKSDRIKFIEEITTILEENNKQAPNEEIQEDQNLENFTIIEFNQTKDANQAVQTLCNKKSKEKLPILCGLVDKDKMEDIFNFLGPTLNDRITERVVDLGDLKPVINEKIDGFGVGSFVSLLAACFCHENDSRKRIKRMSMNNDEIQRGQFMYTLKLLFPNLKKISILGKNPIAKNTKFIQSMKDSGLQLLTKAEEIDFELPIPATEKEIEYAPNLYSGRFIKVIDPTLLRLGHPEQQGRVGSIDISRFTPCDIDPDEFPTNQFIINFLDTSWNKIEALEHFYAEKAKFSITAKDGGPGSPLERYEKYSRNLLLSGGNCIIGSNLIVDAQKELFVNGFYAYPTLIESSRIDDDLYIVIIHGVFQDPYTMKQDEPYHRYKIEKKVVLMFDRTLVLNDSMAKDYVISNDHIYIHNILFDTHVE